MHYGTTVKWWSMDGWMDSSSMSFTVDETETLTSIVDVWWSRPAGTQTLWLPLPINTNTPLGLHPRTLPPVTVHKMLRYLCWISIECCFWPLCEGSFRTLSGQARGAGDAWGVCRTGGGPESISSLAHGIFTTWWNFLLSSSLTDNGWNMGLSYRSSSWFPRHPKHAQWNHVRVWLSVTSEPSVSCTCRWDLLGLDEDSAVIRFSCTHADTVCMHTYQEVGGVTWNQNVDGFRNEG